MSVDLERLLAELGEAQPDAHMDGIVGGVGRRIAERHAAGTQTWRLRAAAMLIVAATGVAVSGAMTPSAAADTSPFDAWSKLAPSSLLD